MLHRECFSLFPDEMFADLFTDVGRRSVPPMVVAVVMVLQRIEGCSDREAVDRFAFDARWKYAAGGLDFDYPGFVHTVLVDMRARLASSDAPDRIFQVTLEAARKAGLVGRKRVLDSTPLYDAVATMDTVTLIRSGIRGLLKAADADVGAELRGCLRRQDDYTRAGKPVCDYDDGAARTALVDALAKDALAALGLLQGRELDERVSQAAALLATVVGQDLDEGVGGVFTIARRVAPDRVISTVDTQARHGRKTSARGFDGYKGHLAIEPDAEIITATTVTPGNTGDAAAARRLLAQDLPAATGTAHSAPPVAEPVGESEPGGPGEQPATAGAEPLAVYGDAAYGAGALLADLEDAGATIMTKVQPPVAPGGRFAKDRFVIDPAAGTVTCPAGLTVSIRAAKAGGGAAAFGAACGGCPLAAACTTSRAGRTIKIGAHEDELVRARATQQDPAWRADYRATRPKVERKIGHLMRRRHGGRRARVRGRVKLAADFSLLAAATNLARLGVLGLTSLPGQGWAVTAS
ncbi:MAG: transposase [Pirellulales bacterium]